MQLRNRLNAPVADYIALEQDIEACRGRLQEKSGQEVERRLARLQLRWNWFRAVYGRRDEIAAMVAGVEKAKADAASDLREYIETVDAAEQRINAIVNSNRPILAEFVRKECADCVALANSLRHRATADQR